MVRHCPNCGARAEQRDTFCVECGESLDQPAAETGQHHDTHDQQADAWEEDARPGDEHGGGQRGADPRPGERGYGGGQPGGGPPQAGGPPGGGSTRGPSEPLPRLGALDTVSEAFSWALSVPILLGAFLVASIVSSLGPVVPGLGLVGNLLTLFVGGVAFIYTARITAGDQPEGTVEEFGDTFSEVFSVALSLVGAALAYGIVVVLGLLLFIIPGIYLGARLSLALPAIVLDGESAIDGLSRSWDVAEGNVLKLVGIFLIQIFALAGASLVVALTGVFIDELLFLLLLSPITAIAGATVQMALARVYLENRNRAPAQGRPNRGRGY